MKSPFPYILCGLIVVVIMTLVIIAVEDGEMSRTEAAQWANEFCLEHEGVNTDSQNGFFYDATGDGETNVTCADGTVGAKEG